MTPGEYKSYQAKLTKRHQEDQAQKMWSALKISKMPFTMAHSNFELLTHLRDAAIEKGWKATVSRFAENNSLLKIELPDEPTKRSGCAECEDDTGCKCRGSKGRNQ